jgi:hypothetical protein
VWPVQVKHFSKQGSFVIVTKAIPHIFASISVLTVAFELCCQILEELAIHTC